MKEKKKKENKVIYYSDEKNDDFFEKKINPIYLSEDFKYIHKNPFYRFFSFLICCFIVCPLLRFLSFITVHTKVKNKKILKEVKHKGYFLYSNHTGVYDIFNDAGCINTFKKPIFIASTETFSIKGLKHLVIFLGAIPVPKGDKMYQNYVDCMNYHIKHKHKIIIYPEAHIWPFFTGIREFSAGSFRYPVIANAPIVVATTTFKKRKFRKIPKEIIYLDGPFYPDTSLSFEKATEKLRNETYCSMISRSDNKKNYAYYHYIKK